MLSKSGRFAAFALVMLLPVAVFGSASKGDGKDAAAKPPASSPSDSAPDSITGKVLETMDSGGYTYMKVKADRGELWAAVGKSPVKVGDTVTILGPTMMGAFESPTLHKKFDQIWFGVLAGPAAPKSHHDGTPLTEQEKREELVARHAGAATPSGDVAKVEVKKAAGGNGKTVAEVHAGRVALDGKSVAVRGQVVKVNRGVMGRNWVHLRDGSGGKAAGDDDLVFTTQDVVATGDVVLATGTVKKDRDFGAGYVYTVIVEDAKLVKE